VDDLLVCHLGTIGYSEGLELQEQVRAARKADAIADTLLLLEHPPVFTAGKRTLPEHRPVDGTPVVDVDRGGLITWHGPGQLVGYPIVRLPRPLDVVAYVRAMEQLLIDVCAALGVLTERVEGRTGVWLRGPDRKIAAIGVRVRRVVAMHGFALNCDPDLTWYDRIVPCGIADAGVTSLSRELGRDVTVAEVLPIVEAQLPSFVTGLDRHPVTA